MQRATEIVSGVFSAIGRFIKNFSIDLSRAVYFKAQEYDQHLQETTTLPKRIGIWAGITTVVLLILYIISYFVFEYINNLGFVDTL